MDTTTTHARSTSHDTHTRDTSPAGRVLRWLAVILCAVAATTAARAQVDPWAVTLNGCEYGRGNFEGFRYADESPCGGFRVMIYDLAQEMAGAWTGTSGSSLTIGTGAHSLTLSTGRAFAVGQPVRIAEASDPAGTFMDGSITAWDPETFSMTVEADAVSGSGTYTAWSVWVMRSESTVVSGPLPIADGGTGATTPAQALTNLGVSRVRFTLSRTNTPPGSPTTGVHYIVGPTGDTGAWAAADPADWAVWDGSAWTFESPTTGDAAVVLFDILENSTPGNASGLIVQWTGSAWSYVVPIFERQSITSGTTAMVYSGATSYPRGSVLEVTKTGTSAATYTLVSANANRDVRVRNQGASGDITVNVASAGTVNGAASITVEPGELAMLYQVGTGVWVALQP